LPGLKSLRPSSNYTVSNAGASGWTGSSTSSTGTFTGGTSWSGDSKVFVIDVQVGPVLRLEKAGTVQVSDSSDGTSPYSCSGSTSVSISSGGTDTTPPNILTLTVSDIFGNFSEDKLDQPMKYYRYAVYYGTTIAYGSTSNSSTAGTSHSITLSSLTASTVYHYSIRIEEHLRKCG